MSICRVASSGPITAHLGTRAEVLPADGDLGARRPLPRRDATHYRGRAHGQSNIFLNYKYFLQDVETSYGFFLQYRLSSEIRSLEDNITKMFSPPIGSARLTMTRMYYLAAPSSNSWRRRELRGRTPTRGTDPSYPTQTPRRGSSARAVIIK